MDALAWLKENTPSTTKPPPTPKQQPPSGGTFLQGFHIERHPKFGETSY